MKTRSVLLIVTLLTLGLALGGTVSAQAPQPGRPVEPSYRPPQPDALPAEDEAKPFVGIQAAAGDLDSPAAPAIATGQPGLSFRYERMFGETRVPYLTDADHLHHPYGVTIAGDRLWIAESEGLRALQFTTAGAFVSQIGRAGIHDVWEYGASIDYPSDVAVAPDGHIWLVNKWANTLLEFDSAGNYLQEVGVRWNCVADNTGFCSPTSIAFDAYGNRFVSDSDNHRIQVYSPGGIYQTTLGVSGVAGSDREHLNNPEHIAIYDGLLYVADAQNHRVQIFNIAIPGMYTWAGTIGFRPEGGSGPGELMWPAGVAVNAHYIFVADSDNHRVSVYHRESQAYAVTVGTGWGTGPTEFKNPRDVALDAAGNLYVADWNNCRVQQFEGSELTYVRTFGTTGAPYVTDGNHYYHPFGVAVGPDGSLHILEERSGHRLVKLDAAGVFQWSVGEPGIAGGWDAGDNTHLNWPGDVAVDGAGRVYVADSGNDRVQIYDAGGSYLGTLGAWGAGNTQFKAPAGLFAAADGSLYVADRDNQRVQIFNSARQYVATLGVIGQTGADNAHFNRPSDVAVDSRGWIYVSDAGNQRVQVFDAQRRYVRTIGVTGEGGDDYAHLGDPNKLAVDVQDRLYIADGWSNRVVVYDANSAFLTMIGGSAGERTGDLRGATGLAVDADGAVYVTDYWDNARVQKFAAGVPGWRQVNINGFGDRWHTGSGSLAAFAGSLYHGTGAQLWRMDAQDAWTLVRDDGLGDKNNWYNHLYEFKGQLYAGLGNSVCDDPDCNTSHSNGGEVWRSSDGAAWSRVGAGGFGDTDNAEVQVLTAFGGQLYAATWSYSDAQGTEIWRSSTGNAGDWTRVASNGFGDAGNSVVLAFAVHNGYLYAGTRNPATGGEVWRTANGIDWTQVNTDGFGDVKTIEVASLSAYGGALYVGAYNRTTGGQIWRCTSCAGTDWSRVVGDGFGHVENRRVAILTTFNGALYAVTNNYGGDGMEIRRTTDGTNWALAAPAGLGDSNNRGPYWGYSVATANNRLYIGTSNNANGAEIWVKTLTAGFTATPTQGATPLAVQFTNTSAGDYTSSQWDFGDGATSTEATPSHTYTRAGTYTVTLTVGDGAETSSHSAVIRVLGRFYLPLIERSTSANAPAPIIPATTNVLPEATTRLLTDVSADGTTYTFAQSTAALTNLSPGEVMVGGSCANAPRGFLRKVTAVRMAGAQTIVETTPATLEDAIVQGRVEFNQALKPESVQQTALAAGVSAPVTGGGASEPAFHLELERVVIYDADGHPETTGDQVIVNGSVDVKPTISFRWEVRQDAMPVIKFTINAEQRAELNLEAKLAKDSLKAEKELARYILTPVTVMVGILPVVFVPEVTISVSANGQVQVGVKTGITENATVTAGAEYAGGQWTPIAQYTPQFTFTPPTLYATLDAKGTVGARVELLLYGIAGPYAELNGYLELKADTRKAPWWELFGGIYAPVGVDGDLLDVPPIKLVAIEAKTKLAQASTSCASAPQLQNPPNGQTLNTLIPLLQWNNGDDPAATSSYMQLARDPFFADIVDWVSSEARPGADSWRETRNLNTVMTYYWRVYLLCGATVNSPASEVRSFTTGSGGSIPTAPKLIAPKNDAILPNTIADLQWESVSGAVEYQMRWRRNGGYPYHVLGIQRTSGQWTLQPSSFYEWSVTARNDYAWGPESTRWSFTTGANTSLAPNSVSDVSIEAGTVVDSRGNRWLMREENDMCITPAQ